MIKQFFLLILMVLYSWSLSANTDVYLVKKGESLSQALYNLDVCPIYGANGWLEKIKKLNPEIDFSIPLMPNSKLIVFTEKYRKDFETKNGIKHCSQKKIAQAIKPVKTNIAKKQNPITKQKRNVASEISEDIQIVKVKLGEYVSKVLYYMDVCPIYGSKGWLNRIKKINPNLDFDKKILPSEEVRVYTKKYRDDFSQKYGLKICSQFKSTEVADEQRKANVEIVNEKINRVDIDSAPPARSLASDENELNIQPTPNEKVSSEPVVLSRKSENNDQYRFWKIKPLLSWRNLQSLDSSKNQINQLQALSSTSFGLRVEYGFSVSDNLDLSTEVGIESVRFNEDNDITLNTKLKNLDSETLRLTWFKQTSVLLQMADSPYLQFNNSTSMDLKKVKVPSIQFAQKFNLYDDRLFKSQVEIGLKYIIPSTANSFKLKNSIGYNSLLEFDYKNESFVIGYESFKMKSNSNNTSIQNIFWNYVWNIR